MIELPAQIAVKAPRQEKQTGVAIRCLKQRGKVLVPALESERWKTEWRQMESGLNA